VPGGGKNKVRDRFAAVGKERKWEENGWIGGKKLEKKPIGPWEKDQWATTYKIK